MIKSLHLKNMRCFKDFSLEDIGKINIISGKNNVGKSTLLESVFLLFAYNSPDLFIKTSAIRGIPVLSFTPELLWEPLFYQLNSAEELKISCKDEEGKEQSLSLQKDESFSVALSSQLPVQHDLRPMPGGYPLKAIYKYGKNKATGHFIPQTNSMSTQWNSPPPQTHPVVQYLGPRSTDHINGIAQIFGKAELSGAKDVLLETLRLLDSSIVDLSTIVIANSAYLYARRSNSKSLLPLSAMGDGISKLLMFLCSMYTTPGSILLIDEIENGFHYSFLPTLWAAIKNAIEKTNCQIFATTHSYECISAAVSDAENIDAELLTYVRLGKENNSIVPHVFRNSDLAFALENEMEVR
jgi:Predicted ATPases